MRFDHSVFAVPLCFPALVAGACIPKSSGAAGASGLDLHQHQAEAIQSGAPDPQQTGGLGPLVAEALEFIDGGQPPDAGQMSSLVGQWRNKGADHGRPSPGGFNGAQNETQAVATSAQLVSTQPASAAAPPPEPAPLSSSSISQSAVIAVQNKGVAPPTAATQSASTSQAPSPQPSSSGDGPPVLPGDHQTYVDEHNKYRRQHGAPDVKWKDELADAAHELAKRCKFEHSGGKYGPYGENIAAGGFADVNDIAGTVKSWYDEWTSYDINAPQMSTDPKVKTGHFTQLVWKDTKHIGCSTVNCAEAGGTAGGAFTVCEYDPPGNMFMPEPNTKSGYENNVQPKPNAN